MRQIRAVSQWRGLALCAVAAVAACSDGDRPQPLSQITTIPAADTTTRVNFNSSNPALVRADNDEVDPGETLTLVWSDEFNGSKLDPADWFFETGDGSQYGLIGWGNDELQWYLPDSAQLSDGKLKITARRETANGYSYTSARINTQDRFAFRYGRVEASIKLPPGQGIWPAFWLLAQDSPYGGWAASGEIDVMEARNLGGTGSDRNRIFGTIHYGGVFPNNLSTSGRYSPSTSVIEEFNTYAVEWDVTEIRWYVNDTLYAVQNSWSSTGAAFPAPFDQYFYIIFNVAVGGRFPGPPTGATQLPVTMEVDWVRVYSGEP